jgi:hypothetical protein
MPDVACFPNALDPESLRVLRDRSLSSSLVGKSTLMGTFAESRGFGIIVKAEGLDQLKRAHPHLQPFLELCWDPERQKKLLAPPLRLFGQRALPRPNAFYINLLLVSEGGAVGPHVDATLREPAHSKDAVPNWVSVLYLDVPETMQGGALCLHGGDYGPTRIQPETGLFLHFRGELTHEVEAVSGFEAGSHRASLIMEQYTLKPEELKALPTCQVQTRAGFKRYLKDGRRQ